MIHGGITKEMLFSALARHGLTYLTDRRLSVGLSSSCIPLDHSSQSTIVFEGMHPGAIASLQRVGCPPVELAFTVAAEVLSDNR